MTARLPARASTCRNHKVMRDLSGDVQREACTDTGCCRSELAASLTMCVELVLTSSSWAVSCFSSTVEGGKPSKAANTHVAVRLLTWNGSPAAEQGRTMSMLTSPDQGDRIKCHC